MAKIRKIKEKELIGGTSNIEVYPITHAEAVYDKNNTPLSDTLEFLNTEVNHAKQADLELLRQIDNEAKRATRAEEILSEKIVAINNSIVYITQEEYDYLLKINAVQENVEYNIISDE